MYVCCLFVRDPGCYPGLGNERPFWGGRVAHLLGICYIPAYDGAEMPRIVLMPLQGVRSLIVRA